MQSTLSLATRKLAIERSPCITSLACSSDTAKVAKKAPVVCPKPLKHVFREREHKVKPEFAVRNGTTFAV